METERKMPTVGTLLKVHEDRRRVISEYNSRELNFSVNHFHITGSDPLGNHYHKLKSETFVITSGFGIAVLASVNEHGEVLGVKKRHRLAPNSVVHVPPMTAHAFFFTTDAAEMLSWSSTAFAEDPPHDTYACRLT